METAIKIFVIVTTIALSVLFIGGISRVHQYFIAPRHREEEEHTEIAPVTMPVDPPHQYFTGFIGNEGPVELLIRLIKYARLAGEQKIANIAFFGPRSTGKTELSRRMAKALGIPLIVLDRTTIGSTRIFAKKLKELSTGLDENGVNVLPQVIMFIDEAHTLQSGLQDLLLTATEPTDRYIVIADDEFDCNNVTFVIATTDPAKLGDPFRSRFTVLNLEPYNTMEVVHILEKRIESDETIDRAALQLNRMCLTAIAKAARNTPRIAIEVCKQIAIAVAIGDIQPDIDSVHEDLNATLGCDEEGYTKFDKAYIQFLKDNGVSGLASVSDFIGQDKNTVQHIIEPYLLRMGFIRRTPKGRRLTPKGIEFAESLA